MRKYCLQNLLCIILFNIGMANMPLQTFILNFEQFTDFPIIRYKCDPMHVKSFVLEALSVNSAEVSDSKL